MRVDKQKDNKPIMYAAFGRPTRKNLRPLLTVR
jgi:hypothetical protein